MRLKNPTVKKVPLGLLGGGASIAVGALLILSHRAVPVGRSIEVAYMPEPLETAGDSMSATVSEKTANSVPELSPPQGVPYWIFYTTISILLFLIVVLSWWVYTSTKVKIPTPSTTLVQRAWKTLDPEEAWRLASSGLEKEVLEEVVVTLAVNESEELAAEIARDEPTRRLVSNLL